MKRHLYQGEAPDDELGAVVHGPALLGRATGVAVGIRCVFGYPGGLAFTVVLCATGVHGEAAARQHGYHAPPGPVPLPPRLSELTIEAEVNGIPGPVGTGSGQSYWRDERFWSESHCFVDVLPTDGRLVLMARWVQVGLPRSRTELTLNGLDGLAGNVIALR
ncbi:hypothetical protein Val02_88330 [Virgisporangium aliadipatigenens]|uniref:Uncharacterized protein n=1 Tax=Virgisporangium aliadipatigenens TaxID=741659 RepID=A0A8J3YWF9_9ACTN|nr:hypothetical protein [Virgisporangium aliadipatigenens]GIJ51947.1 hypothetical protein Val02_88330 [Virgisporangium aliadipatigenens]